MRDRIVRESGREKWEEFFRKHGRPRFFKEKRYLTLEFPCLTREDPPIKILDVGSGYGSSILPILAANQSSTAVAIDISQVALDSLNTAAASAGISSRRLESFCLDISSDLYLSIPPIDFALMVFSLSSIHPTKMPKALHNVRRLLKPGGMLLIRDYGLCDMSQLRYSSSQCLDKNLYFRQDGTLAYYFTPEFLSDMAERSGFTTDESKYACVSMQNRKTSTVLNRVFIHGIFTNN